MKNYGIIFDLDGTLADTLQDILFALNEMLDHYGFPKVTMARLNQIINRGAEQLVFDAIPDGTVPSVDDPFISEALDFYSNAYASHPLLFTKPYAGMPEALLALKKAGFQLGVLSNKQDELVKTIVETLFPGMFSFIAGQSIYPPKPNPIAPLHVAKQLNVAPENCIFCGDSDIDMKTGVNSGMFSLGVLWGYRSKETLLSSGAKLLFEEPKDFINNTEKLKSIFT